MKTSTLVMRSVWSAWKRKKPVAGYDHHAPVSLSLNSGEWLAVLGTNGVGKSTLLRAIAGIADVCGGIVQIDGRTIRPYRAIDRYRLGVAYVGQQPALRRDGLSWSDAMALAFAYRPGLQNEHALGDLQKHLRAHGWLRDERIEPSLFDVVVAVMAVPTVLLLDEGDARAKASEWTGDRYAVLKELLPDTTVVFVEHDVVRACAAATRVLILGYGPAPQLVSPAEAMKTLASSATMMERSPEVTAPDYWHDAERLLDLEASPASLLRRCLLAGGVMRVREWLRQLKKDWPFLLSDSNDQLSGGERIIVSGLAAAAAGGVAFDERLIAHVAHKRRMKLAMYRRVLSSLEVRRYSTKAIADILDGYNA